MKFLNITGLSRFYEKLKQVFVKSSGTTTQGNIVTYGDSGTTIVDSGYTIAASVPADAKFTDTTYTASTTDKDGLMSATDKEKMDGIESGAEVNILESVQVNGTALSVTNKAVNIDLSSYATKNDISTVYSYKGTVATYSALPTSNNKVGDVYNIETKDTANNIKAGDNVAWNGTSWDNLSGVVEIDISEITTAEIDALFV